MKRTNICPKCQHNEVLFLREVNDETQDTSERWRIGRLRQEKKELFRSRPMINITGLVQAYVCRGCGFTEFYTQSPGQMEYDGETIQLLKGPEPKGPYQ